MRIKPFTGLVLTARRWTRFLIIIISIVEVKLLWVGAHFKTVNTLSYKPFFNWVSAVPCGGFSLHAVGRAFPYVFSLLELKHRLVCSFRNPWNSLVACPFHRSIYELRINTLVRSAYFWIFTVSYFIGDYYQHSRRIFDPIVLENIHFGLFCGPWSQHAV